ncbi:MAG: WD40 repeat domain-containing protein, partial [Candidatus Kariarchaeaceae archaeon]
MMLKLKTNLLIILLCFLLINIEHGDRLSSVNNSDDKNKTIYLKSNLIDFNPKLEREIPVDWSVSSIDSSPDGTKLLSIGYDSNRQIELHDLTTSNSIWEKSIESGLYGTFSPDGTKIALSDRGYSSLLSTTDGSIIRNFQNGNLPPVFSSDGSKLATGSTFGGVSIFDTNSGEILEEIAINQNDTFEFFDYSPDGEELLIGYTEGWINVWNISSNSTERWIQAHDNPVLSVFYSPNGSYFVSSTFNELKMWEANTGALMWSETTLIGQNRISIDFSPDGNVLASAGLDTISFWSVTTGEVLYTLKEEIQRGYEANRGLKFSGDGTRIFSVISTPKGHTINVYLLNRDIDEDGMDDDYETSMGLNPGDYLDAHYDFDEDGLTNLEEFIFGSWANRSDTDLDGMSDYYEFVIGLNPKENDGNDDKDNDGLSNLWEYQMGLNASEPIDAFADLDNDGMSTLYEYQNGLDANDPSDNLTDLDNDGLNNLLEYHLGSKANSKDSDEDLMTDDYEYQMGLKINIPDADEDLDEDGLTNYVEFSIKSWANTSDTDNDELPDYYEYEYNFDLLQNDSWIDHDNDGIATLTEYRNGTNPRSPLSVPIF